MPASEQNITCSRNEILAAVAQRAAERKAEDAARRTEEQQQKKAALAAVVQDAQRVAARVGQRPARLGELMGHVCTAVA